MRAFIIGCCGVIGGLAIGGWAVAQTSQVNEETNTVIQQSTETVPVDPTLIMVAPTQEVSPTDPSLAVPIDDPDALRAQNRRLKEQIRALESERDALVSERDALAARIAEMTGLGGSLVAAYCPSLEISRNTAGAEENCTMAGYVCAPVSGLCRTSCQSSEHCAGGFVCDIAASRCVLP